MKDIEIYSNFLKTLKHLKLYLPTEKTAAKLLVEY